MHLRTALRRSGLLLAALVLLIVCTAFSAHADSTANPGYEYYYQQLDANQQALYRFILAAPAETATYTVTLPQDGSGYDSIGAMLQTAATTAIYDHPETMAWLMFPLYRSYSAKDNALTFELVCSDYYDPADQAMSEKLVDTIVAAADPTWDLYTKARFISNAVIDALDYDANYVFYNENGKADYYNSNIYCVNNGYGICGGFSKLYKAVADRVGLPCVEVGSVGHAWVHVKMEDGNWYGVDPQMPDILQGLNSMLGWNYVGGNDMYVLYDEFFAEDGSISQPERPMEDYSYPGVEPDPGSVDLTDARKDDTTAATTFLYTVNEDGKTCTVTGFTGKQSGDLIIPDKLGGCTVTAIGTSAFTYADFDGTLTIPDTVEIIGAQAFAGCRDLTGQLVLPQALKRIHSAAFISCEGLTGEIVFGDQLTHIYASAFAQCSGFTGSLWLPDCLFYIEGNAFYNCDGLDGVVHIPDSIAAWNAGYIDSCDSISGFDVSDNHPSLTVYERVLYSRDMTTLLSCANSYTGTVDIPEGVQVISEQAFYRCQSITALSLPSTLKRIEAWGCSYLTGLTEEITLPDSLEYLGPNAFYCSSIPGTLVYPHDMELCEDAFGAVMNLERLIFAEGVTSVPGNAFQSGVQEVCFPSTIQQIGSSCFGNSANLFVYGYAGTAAETFVSEDKTLAYGWSFIPLADGMALSRSALSLVLDETIGASSCQLTIMPHGTSGDILWASSDEKIATVTDGLVTAVSTGTATISASVDNLTLTCTVTVYDNVLYSADGKTLLKVSADFTGELLIPEGVVSIANGAIQSGQGITSLVLPSTLHTIQMHAVYGLGHVQPVSLVIPDTVISIGFAGFQNSCFGELVYPVIAEVDSSAFAFCQISTLILPEGVTALPQHVFQFAYIDSLYLPASLTNAPLNAFENATVGTFYGYSGTFAESYVAQLQTKYPDKTFTFVSLGEPINHCTCVLGVGETIQLAWKEEVTWSSSNEAVATVDETGLVTALANGCAYITAAAPDGTTAACRITVGGPGDLNRDGVTDMLDIIDLMDWFCGNPVSIVMEAADVNADDTVNMLDVIHLMEWYCDAEVELL